MIVYFNKMNNHSFSLYQIAIKIKGFLQHLQSIHYRKTRNDDDYLIEKI